MTPLASVADVEKRLGRDITTDEQPTVDGLLEEASIEVSEYCGTTFPDGVPDTVRVVVSRLVVRGMQAEAADDYEPGLTQRTDQVGEWQESRSYLSDASSGGVWLTRADKRKLANYSIRGGAFSVDLTPS